MELIGSLRIIDAILVCETNEEVKIGTSGEMCVVHCWLGHFVQAVKDGRIFNARLHCSIITLYVGSVSGIHFLAQFIKFGVDNSLFIRQRYFRDSMIHHCVLPE